MHLLPNNAKVLKAITQTNCERLSSQFFTWEWIYLKIELTYDPTGPPMKYTAEKHKAGHSGAQHASSPYELAQQSSGGHVQETGPEQQAWSAVQGQEPGHV